MNFASVRGLFRISSPTKPGKKDGPEAPGDDAAAQKQNLAQPASGSSMGEPRGQKGRDKPIPAEDKDSQKTRWAEVLLTGGVLYLRNELRLSEEILDENVVAALRKTSGSPPSKSEHDFVLCVAQWLMPWASQAGRVLERMCEG